MSIELVMTDHDGVIMDSSELVFQALWNLMSEHLSFGTDRQKRFPSFSDFLRSFRLPGDEWLREFGFDFSTEEVTEVVRQAPIKAPMFPAVPSLLARIQKECRLPIVMISAGDQPRIERQLSFGRILRHFELVIGGSQEKTMAVAFFCSAFGVDPAKVVYVGDRPSDMESGCEAGVTTIGFTDERPMMKKVLTEAGAHHCVSDHRELGELIMQLVA